tara:strand:- start:170 stop:310 length:141 start_codon:yes stop_codon:yes gene_type:complete
MPEKLVNNKYLETYIFKPFIPSNPEFEMTDIGQIFPPMVIVLTELF